VNQSACYTDSSNRTIQLLNPQPLFGKYFWRGWYFPLPAWYSPYQPGYHP
jgi:hypothetical protein